MRLMALYCAVVVIGEVLIFPIGLAVERLFPSLSMLVYMAMFFGVLWGGWPVAVFLTERFLLSPEDLAASRAGSPSGPKVRA
jgi:hypothetical protein